MVSNWKRNTWEVTKIQGNTLIKKKSKNDSLKKFCFLWQLAETFLQFLCILNYAGDKKHRLYEL